MNSAISDIDHFMISVADSAKAADIFARMGFTITPQGQLPGLSNRLICFAGGRSGAPNFIELMSLDDAEKAPPSMALALKQADRPVLIVAATENAETTHAQLSKTGLEVAPVIDGNRDWTLPDGEVLELEFSIVLPEVGQAPFYWIACQHKTPQHYLRKGFVTHKNAGVLLKKIIAVSQNPRSAASHFAENWAASISMPDSKSAPVVVRRGTVELHIFDRHSFDRTYPGVVLQQDEDHLAGISVSVKSLRSLSDILQRGGFQPIVQENAVIIPPSQACGCLVIFEENKIDISKLDLGPLPI